MPSVRNIDTLLDHILAREPEIRAFAHLDTEALRKSAKVREASGANGPLAGQVVAVKDLFDTYDMPTSLGSPIYQNNRPPRDAAAVASIRAAGGLIVGKTVTTEFAHMTPGPTRNPHNFERTPGGSSSGSAAAVAAKMVDMAIGTQTAGSIIRPAAFCGIVGFKPTVGSISRSGLGLFSETLDTIGGFGRDVRTASLLIGVMAKRDGLLKLAAPPTPRIAVWATGDSSRADAVAVAELHRVADQAANAGAHVTAFAGGQGWHDLLDAHGTIMAYEGAQSLGYELRHHPELLSEQLRTYLTNGRKISGNQWLAARQTARQQGATLHAEMGDFDAIMTLSAPGAAPPKDAGTGDPHFNKVWTLLGGPAIHVPTGASPDKQPLGVQIYGLPDTDEQTASVALWLETMLS